MKRKEMKEKVWYSVVSVPAGNEYFKPGDSIKMDDDGTFTISGTEPDQYGIQPSIANECIDGVVYTYDLGRLYKKLKKIKSKLKKCKMWEAKKYEE